MNIHSLGLRRRILEVKNGLSVARGDHRIWKCLGHGGTCGMCDRLELRCAWPFIHQTPAAIFWLFVVQMEQGQRQKEHILQQACQRDPSASMQLQTVSSTFFNIDLTPQLLQPNHAKSALIPANNKAPIRRMSPKRYGPAVASDSVLGARASFSISVLLRQCHWSAFPCATLTRCVWRWG